MHNKFCYLDTMITLFFDGWVGFLGSCLAEDESLPVHEDADFAPEEDDDNESWCEEECEDEETCTDSSDSPSSEEPTAEELASCVAEVLIPDDKEASTSGPPELAEEAPQVTAMPIPTNGFIDLVVHKLTCKRGKVR